MMMLRGNPDGWRLNGEKRAGTRARGQAVHALMVAHLAPVVAAAKAFFAAGALLEMAHIVKVAFFYADAPTRVHECAGLRCSPDGRVLGPKTERLWEEEPRLEASLGGAGGGEAADGVRVGAACVSIPQLSYRMDLL